MDSAYILALCFQWFRWHSVEFLALSSEIVPPIEWWSILAFLRKSSLKCWYSGACAPSPQPSYGYAENMKLVYPTFSGAWLLFACILWLRISVWLYIFSIKSLCRSFIGKRGNWLLWAISFLQCKVHRGSVGTLTRRSDVLQMIEVTYSFLLVIINSEGGRGRLFLIWGKVYNYV